MPLPPAPRWSDKVPSSWPSRITVSSARPNWSSTMTPCPPPARHSRTLRVEAADREFDVLSDDLRQRYQAASAELTRLETQHDGKALRDSHDADLRGDWARPNRISYSTEKRARENAKRARAEAKRARRQHRPEGSIDPIGKSGPEERFPSAYPGAPPEAEGIARLLSRGL